MYYQHVVNGKTVQDSCGPNMAHLPAGVGQFSDTCNHLHIQVPKNYN
jgi:hypothetical protein